jgi:protocatechuate 3,4-dioxygenase beta subunit
VSLTALLALHLLAASPQPASGEPQPALVTGRVLDADGGRPIPGAIVMPFGSATPAPASRVLTNANGEFVIRGLRAGTLVLLATKGGYIDAAHGQTRPSGFGQPVRVASGERYLDVDIRMWRHGVITGTVVDEAGEPVIGVRVQAFLGTRAGGRTSYAPSGLATTDDRGVYRIPQLAPGDYLVAVLTRQTSVPTEVMDVFFAGASTRAQRDELGREMKRIDAAVVPAGSRLASSVGATTIPLDPGTATPTSQPGGGLLVYPTTFYPAVSTAAQAAPVTVRSGLERANVDLQLRPERTVRVSGSLVGPEWLAAHVAVRLVAAGNDAIGSVAGPATITDSTGGFTFVGVTPGQYTVSAVRVPRPPPDPPDDTKMTVQAGTVAIAPRPPSTAGLAPPPPVPADATLWAQLPLAVGQADLNDVIVPLQQGPRMSGRLEFDGTAERPDLTLLSNLRIFLEPADGSPPAGFEGESGHPDEHGGFRTPGVPPGRYVVRVAGPPLSGWTFKGAQYEGRDLADTAVEMRANDITGVVLTFTDRPASIEGTVQTGTMPDGAAIVAAYPVDEEAWTNAGAAARRIKVARVSADGTFAIANVPAGEYYVIAVKDDPASWLDPALLRSLARAAQQVRVTDGDRKSVTLRTVAIR